MSELEDLKAELATLRNQLYEMFSRAGLHQEWREITGVKMPTLQSEPKPPEPEDRDAVANIWETLRLWRQIEESQASRQPRANAPELNNK